MGANSTQALGVTIFLIAFTILAGAMAAGGSVILTVIALAGLAISAGILIKAKPWEHQEEE
jgi:VIT1/CCC1 family predicted Fe2+/Mn2+ transporter